MCGAMLLFCEILQSTGFQTTGSNPGRPGNPFGGWQPDFKNDQRKDAEMNKIE